MVKVNENILKEKIESKLMITHLGERVWILIKLSFIEITYIQFSINKDCKIININFSLIAAMLVLGKEHNLICIWHNFSLDVD